MYLKDWTLICFMQMLSLVILWILVTSGEKAIALSLLIRATYGHTDLTAAEGVESQNLKLRIASDCC